MCIKNKLEKLQIHRRVSITRQAVLFLACAHTEIFCFQHNVHDFVIDHRLMWGPGGEVSSTQRYYAYHNAVCQRAVFPVLIMMKSG
jgi:hypothetical protein